MIRITKFMTKFQKFQVLNQLLIQVKMNNLKNLQEAYGDDWTLFDGDSNPLQDVYIVEADSPSECEESG